MLSPPEVVSITRWQCPFHLSIRNQLLTMPVWHCLQIQPHFTLTPDVCHFPRQVFKVGGEGSMQVHGSQVRRAYSLWRSGTSQLVDQGLLGLTTLLWVKACCLPKHAWHNLPPNSWSTAPLSHAVIYLRVNRQKRTGSWRLSPLRGERLSSPAHFAQHPPVSERTPAVSLPQENPTPRETAALTELENEQQQGARRQYLPQGGSNLSQQPSVSPGSYHQHQPSALTVAIPQ